MEFLESLKTHIQERFTSPAAGPFIISWVITNYKVLFVLFSSLSPADKFDYIGENIWSDWAVWVRMCLVFPVIGALLYIVVYPWILREVMSYVSNERNKTKNLEIRLAGEAPVSNDDYIKLKNDTGAQIDKLQIAVDKHTETIRLLRNQNDAYDIDIRDLRTNLTAEQEKSKVLSDRVSSAEGESRAFENDFKRASNELEAVRMELAASKDEDAKNKRRLLAAGKKLGESKDELVSLREKLEAWGDIPILDTTLSKATPQQVYMYASRGGGKGKTQYIGDGAGRSNEESVQTAFRNFIGTSAEDDGDEVRRNSLVFRSLRPSAKKMTPGVNFRSKDDSKDD